ncbi:MAG: polysaccharide deacetylase family protein [Chloroflexota bacterium]|nr:polysaccharide deacetylase family protein [Chloroflexota bacterium]
MNPRRVWHIGIICAWAIIFMSLPVAMRNGASVHMVSAQDVASDAQGMRVSPQWDGTYRRIRAPILMYHYVSELPFDADDIRRGLTVTPAQFRSHLDMLFYEGYTPISLYDLHDALLTGRTLPAKPVVLTFDDGHLDAYTQAFPLLREYGFTATFFIITGFADRNYVDHLSWAQIREMADAGMSMEAHTKTHSELDGRTYDFLVYEVLGSLESLAYYTGRQPYMFSYPVGRYDAETLRVMGQTEVWRAVTTERSYTITTDNRLQVPRIRVPGGATAAQLLAILQASE